MYRHIDSHVQWLLQHTANKLGRGLVSTSPGAHASVRSMCLCQWIFMYINVMRATFFFHASFNVLQLDCCLSQCVKDRLFQEGHIQPVVEWKARNSGYLKSSYNSSWRRYHQVLSHTLGHPRDKHILKRCIFQLWKAQVPREVNPSPQASEIWSVQHRNVVEFYSECFGNVWCFRKDGPEGLWIWNSNFQRGSTSCQLCSPTAGCLRHVISGKTNCLSEKHHTRWPRNEKETPAELRQTMIAQMPGPCRWGALCTNRFLWLLTSMVLYFRPLNRWSGGIPCCPLLWRGNGAPLFFWELSRLRPENVSRSADELSRWRPRHSSRALRVQVWILLAERKKRFGHVLTIARNV